MSLLKPQIFLPLCLAGILTGYGAAEYVVPKYFHPTAQTQLTPQDIIDAIGAQPNYFRQTPSGNYLAGQFAQRHKDWAKASEYINRVLREQSDDPDLEKSSMLLTMAAGDADKSIELAKKVLAQDPSNLLAILFVTTENFKQNNFQEALNNFGKVQNDNIAGFIVPVLKLWAEAGLGNFSVETLTPNSFYAYQALLAGTYANKKAEALEFATSAFKVEENDIRDLEKYADAFLVYGKTEMALDIYKSIEDRGFADKEVKTKIDNLENSLAFKKEVALPEIKSPKDGAALVYQDMAEILLREMSDDSATIFAQMALYLNPALDKNHAIIAEVFTRNESFELAIRELQKINLKSEYYAESQRKVAELYAELDQHDKAIEILQKLYQSNDDIDALIQIGDIYRYQEDYLNAKITYTKVLDQWKNPPDDYWHVYYARGMALERLKEFKDAEKDLLKALEVQPNNPYLLNYLGYSWVDQGINLDKSLDMIARAVAFKPNDGYITDSLGWAYYKRGEYEASVPHLERAVELLPYDATINDHLGDAYWQVGRENEAKFQWQRALNYSEDKDLELKDSIKEKLVNGLPQKNQMISKPAPAIKTNL